MRVRIYVDGLNFFHNVAKVINFKWIDLEGCFRQAVEQHLRAEIIIERIKLFSSVMSGAEQESQKIYHKALQAHSPTLEIKLGRFREYTKRRELASDCECADKKKNDLVRVIIWEEKQTDVNLATAIVKDAYTESDEYDLICVVSNDSDLASSVIIKRELQQRIILLAPLIHGHNRDKKPTKFLSNELLNPDRDCIKGFTEEDVRRCALPDVVAGKFRMPDEWR